MVKKRTEKQAPTFLMVICLTPKYCKVAQEVFSIHLQFAFFRKDMHQRNIKKHSILEHSYLKMSITYQGYLVGLLD